MAPAGRMWAQRVSAVDIGAYGRELGTVVNQRRMPSGFSSTGVLWYSADGRDLSGDEPTGVQQLKACEREGNGALKAPGRVVVAVRVTAGKDCPQPRIAPCSCLHICRMCRASQGFAEPRT